MHSCNVQMDHSGLEVRESLPKSGVVNLRAVVFSVGQQRCSRCCISCQIQTKEPGRGKKACRVRVARLREASQAVLILALGKLSKHCQNRAVHLKLCCLDKSVFHFLILLIFSKLWLSKMTWQVFLITGGPASTWLCQLKQNAQKYTGWEIVCAANRVMLVLQ